MVRVEIVGGTFVDIFDRLEEDSYTVFRDKSKLSLSYVPAELVARRREEEYLARILVSGVRDNYLPPMIRVSGPPGSGKTVIVKSVLERFSERTDGFRFFYVNLKGSRTVFMAANAVLSGIAGRRVPSNLGLDRVFDEIWRAIEDGFSPMAGPGPMPPTRPSDGTSTGSMREAWPHPWWFSGPGGSLREGNCSISLCIFPTS